jgi:hypothetical protein
VTEASQPHQRSCQAAIQRPRGKRRDTGRFHATVERLVAWMYSELVFPVRTGCKSCLIRLLVPRHVSILGYGANVSMLMLPVQPLL